MQVLPSRALLWSFGLWLALTLPTAATAEVRPSQETDGALQDSSLPTGDSHVCGEGTLAFDGACRNRRFFRNLAAPRFEISAVTGCLSLLDECSHYVLVTESNAEGAVRMVVLTSAADGGSPSIAGGRRAPGLGSEVRSVGPTPAGGTAAASVDQSPAARERQGYPMVARTLHETTAETDGLTMTTRSYAFESPGRDPRLVASSRVTMEDVDYGSRGDWSAEINAGFCSQDGHWPLASALGLGSDCASGSCFYSITFCPGGPITDGLPTHDPTAAQRRRADRAPAGATTAPTSDATADAAHPAGLAAAGASSCSSLEYPTLFVEFSAAVPDATGLLCREGSGGFGVPVPIASGGGSRQGGFPVCNARFDLSRELAEGLCDVALTLAPAAMAVANWVGNLEYSFSVSAGGKDLGASVGVAGTPANQVKAISDGWSAGSNLARNKGSWCKGLGAGAVYAMAGVSNCLGGSCTGAWSDLPITVAGTTESGEAFSCEATADASCQGGSADSQMGSADCDCELDESSLEVDMASCRPTN